MAVKYRLHKANSKNASINGKWYARVSYGPQDVVTIDDLARDITQETVLTDVEVNGVIMALIRHMTNALREGKRVKLKNFGSFKIGLASTGAESAKKFTVTDNVKGVHTVFQPWTTYDRANRVRTKTFLSGIKLVEQAAYNDYHSDDEPEP